MERASPIAPFSLGTILDRYLARGWLKIFALSLACTTALYLVVDFFDLVDNLLRADNAVWTALRYFLYKLPMVISRVVGFTALFSTLFYLGTLSQNQEITAMRSSGLSLHRISLPLLVLSFLLSVLNLFWNESLVPILTRKAQYIYKTEVRKKPPKTILGTEDVWIRGKENFINIDRFDSKGGTLRGVTVYLLDRDFSLRGLIVAPTARWDGARWAITRGIEWSFLSDGQVKRQVVRFLLPISETPEDLKLLARETEEFSLFDLKKHIADLRGKGIDATEYEVDLQVKMALPLLSLLLVFLGIPFGLRHGSGGGMALAFGITMLIGFGYWFLLAFCISLGHSGALLPGIAAWIPNLTLALVALFFYLGQD